MTPQNEKPYKTTVTFTVDVQMSIPRRYFNKSKLPRLTQCEYWAQDVLTHTRTGIKLLEKLPHDSILIDAAFESAVSEDDQDDEHFIDRGHTR